MRDNRTFFIHISNALDTCALALLLGIPPASRAKQAIASVCKGRLHNSDNRIINHSRTKFWSFPIPLMNRHSLYCSPLKNDWQLSYLSLWATSFSDNLVSRSHWIRIYNKSRVNSNIRTVRMCTMCKVLSCHTFLCLMFEWWRQVKPTDIVTIEWK